MHFETVAVNEMNQPPAADLASATNGHGLYHAAHDLAQCCTTSAGAGAGASIGVADVKPVLERVARSDHGGQLLPRPKRQCPLQSRHHSYHWRIVVIDRLHFDCRETQ